MEQGPRSASPRSSHGDGGAIVLGWLVKMTVLIVVVAVLLFDAVSLALNPLQAQDAADEAAVAAVASWRTSHDGAEALAAARNKIGTACVIPEGGFAMDEQGRVSVKVQREAHTLVAGWLAARLSATKSWTVSDAVASGAP